MNFTCETSEIDGVTCLTPQDVSCEWIKDDNMESNEANFKIKNITKPLSGVSWYKLWMEFMTSIAEMPVWIMAVGNL